MVLDSYETRHSNCYVDLYRFVTFITLCHVTLDEYIFQTDKHNVKSHWEWENGTVRVIELPSDFYGKSVATVVGKLFMAC